MAFANRKYVSVKLHRYVKDGYFAELTSQLEYLDEKIGKTIYVPKGFRTDFASVPRIWHHIVSPIGKHSAAAALHDYLYTKAANFERKEADRIFYEAMISCSVNKITAKVMYYAVRAFGKFSFQKR